MTEARFRVRGGKVDKSQPWCLSVQRCMGEFAASGVTPFDTNNQRPWCNGRLYPFERRVQTLANRLLHHAAKNEVQSNMQVFLSENQFSEGCSKIEAERK